MSCRPGSGGYGGRGPTGAGGAGRTRVVDPEPRRRLIALIEIGHWTKANEALRSLQACYDGG